MTRPPMRVPRLLVRAAFLAAVVASLFEPLALGQQAPAPWASGVSVPRVQAPVIPDNSAAIGDLLRQGYQLESEKRWGDALSHYEDAIRAFPGEASLERRYDFARLHYDVGRRYADRSFLRAADSLTRDEALEVFADVLIKLQNHYVEAPSWKALVERGTNGLEVALSEEVFLARHLPDAEPKVLLEFRRELRRSLGARMVDSRAAARQTVGVAADLAGQRLGIAAAPVVLEFLCGATNSLDPYSSFLTPDQLDEVYSQIEGNFVGLGIELKADSGSLLIVRVIPHSPAEEGGIQSGDRILAVDGQSTRNLSTDEAADLLQGPADSVVELTLARADEPARRLRVRRRRVEVPSIDEARIADAEYGIGYIKLSCFQKTTNRDLDGALWDLHRRGMKSLVIDLRGNPGGLLSSAVEVVDKFVDRGVIVATRGRSPHEDFTYSAHAPGTWRVPLVVMIDEDSASAAEIFAGAIRDHRRGTLVGRSSYGKGSVQGIFPLSSCQAGVRLTTAKFYSPSGHPFNRVGVQPDLVVHRAAKAAGGEAYAGPASAQDDAALAAAMQAARQHLGRR